MFLRKNRLDIGSELEDLKMKFDSSIPVILHNKLQTYKCTYLLSAQLEGSVNAS
jgi:hypothetical protein